MSTKRNWVWNGIVFLALTACILAFVLHYKNWIRFEDGEFHVFSGIYSQRVALEDISEVDWVPKIPKLERESGFSWGTREKGIFLDSVTMGKVYILVDDLERPKIAVRHHDSLFLYINLRDSLETQILFEKLKEGNPSDGL